MLTILHLAALTATVLLLARALPGFHIRTSGTALLVAIVFSLLNWACGWFIKVLLFLPAILTLGLLFLLLPLIVNAVVLWLTDKVLRAMRARSAGSPTSRTSCAAIAATSPTAASRPGSPSATTSGMPATR